MRLRSLVLLIMALLAQAVSAEVEPDYAHPGFYVGGGFTYAVENFDTGELSRRRFVRDAQFEVDDAAGLHTYVGYRFSSRLATEATFEYLGNAEVTTDDDRDAAALIRVRHGKIGNVNSYLSTVGGTFFLLNGWVQPHLGLALGVLYGTGTDKRPCEIAVSAAGDEVARDCLLTGSGVGFAARFGAVSICT